MAKTEKPQKTPNRKIPGVKTPPLAPRKQKSIKVVKGGKK
jgi:hypothetical protein